MKWKGVKLRTSKVGEIHEAQHQTITVFSAYGNFSRRPTVNPVKENRRKMKEWNPVRNIRRVERKKWVRNQRWTEREARFISEGSGKLMVDSVADEFGDVVDAKLLHDIRAMGIDGTGTDKESVGNFLVR